MSLKLETIDVINNGTTSELRACRACLATDTKLYDLQENALAQAFTDLTSIPVIQSDGLPQHVCELCRALLHKCGAFKARSQYAHVLLEGALTHCSLTTAYIQSLDRTNTTYPLCRTEIQTEDIEPDHDEDDDDIKDVQTERYFDDTMEHSDEEKHTDIDPKIEIEIIDQKTDQKLQRDLIKNLDHINIDDLTFDISGLAKVTNSTGHDKHISSNVSSINGAKLEINVKDIKIEKDFILISDDEGNKDVKNHEIMQKQLKKVKKKEESSIDKAYRFVDKLMQLEMQKCRLRRPSKITGETKLNNSAAIANVKPVTIMQKKMVEVQKSGLCQKNTVFKCLKCKLGFAVEATYKKHMLNHQVKPGNFTKKRMEEKAEYMFKNAQFKCEKCRKGFITGGAFKNHMAIHDPSLRRRCDSCRVRFDSAAILTRHMGMQCQPGHKACVACGDAFATTEQLKQHFREQHRQFKCGECNKICSNEANLASHWRYMHGSESCAAGRAVPPAPAHSFAASVASAAKSFVCEVCGKTFKSRFNLTAHLRQHTGETPFECPLCPKRFRRKFLLKEHMPTHTGVRSYPCPYCPMAFKTYPHRVKHLRTHTKEKPYKCSVCDKGFATSWNMREHVNTIHMGQARRQRSAHHKDKEE